MKYETIFQTGFERLTKGHEMSKSVKDSATLAQLIMNMFTAYADIWPDKSLVEITGNPELPAEIGRAFVSALDEPFGANLKRRYVDFKPEKVQVGNNTVEVKPRRFDIDIANQVTTKVYLCPNNQIEEVYGWKYDYVYVASLIKMAYIPMGLVARELTLFVPSKECYGKYASFTYCSAGVAFAEFLAELNFYFRKCFLGLLLPNMYMPIITDNDNASLKQRYKIDGIERFLSLFPCSNNLTRSAAKRGFDFKTVAWRYSDFMWRLLSDAHDTYKKPVGIGASLSGFDGYKERTLGDLDIHLTEEEIEKYISEMPHSKHENHLEIFEYACAMVRSLLVKLPIPKGSHKHAHSEDDHIIHGLYGIPVHMVMNAIIDDQPRGEGGEFEEVEHFGAQANYAVRTVLFYLTYAAAMKDKEYMLKMLRKVGAWAKSLYDYRQSIADEWKNLHNIAFLIATGNNKSGWAEGFDFDFEQPGIGSAPSKFSLLFGRYYSDLHAEDEREKTPAKEESKAQPKKEEKNKVRAEKPVKTAGKASIVPVDALIKEARAYLEAQGQFRSSVIIPRDVLQDLIASIEDAN